MDGVWENVVSEFSKKEFTVKTDKLVAILGVASRFGSLTNFAAGMWHPFIAKHLLWVYDAQASANSHSRDVVEANWKPRHPTWSWISVDYPVCHAVPVDLNELDSNCEFLNFDDLSTPDLGAYRGNEENLGLRVRGKAFKLKAQLKGSPQQVRSFQIALRVARQTFALDCRLDPGCQVGNGNLHALKIASVRGFGTTPITPCSFFLLLEEVAGSQRQFKRVGMGSGPLDAVRLGVGSEADIELTII
jgi:hypothetical protein